MPPIVEAAIQSTERYLKVLSDQGKGVELHPAQRRDGTQVEPCFVDGRTHYKYFFVTAQNLQLQPDDRVIYLPKEDGKRIEARILKYDRRSGKVDLAFSCENSSMGGNLEIDFKWLIRRALAWFREHGNNIKTPPWQFAPAIAVVVHKKDNPTHSAEQIQAIANCLSYGFTYTWGPPGSGKTQFALATTAHRIATAGFRVLVLAPTNNAVDNAIRAVLQSTGQALDRKDVIRLGIPTPEFLAENPDVCEDAEVREKLAQLSNEIIEHKEGLAQFGELQTLQSSIVDLEKQIESISLEILSTQTFIQSLQHSSHQKTEELSSLEIRLAELSVTRTRVLQEKDNLPILTKWLQTAPKRNIDARLSEVDLETLKARSSLNQLRQTHSADLALMKQYEAAINRLTKECSTKEDERQALIERRVTLLGEDWTIDAAEISEALAKLQLEIAKLEDQRSTLELDLAEKKIIGLTLDGFIGRSPTTAISVDYVLVDEAAYAPLVKVLPLLSLQRPIGLFGDHRQLPPVCECDDNDTQCRAYWGQSALFLETAWADPLNFNRLASRSQPEFENMKLTKLTQSYRFDDRLASILRSRVYHGLPLTGVATNPTEIFLLDVFQNLHPEVRRLNLAEVSAVCDLVQLLSNQDQTSIAILTPYRKQVNAIRNKLRHRNLLDNVEVLNTHKAQGREWDTVIFSAVDGAQPPGPFFTDSQKHIGILVLNTTISRVRRQLYLVADRSYWQGRDQLIGDLVSIASPIVF